MNCKNCQKPITANYCPNCGQKADVSRVNFQYVAKELTEGVFQLEYGLFYTIRELFIRPGATIRSFLAGQRKRYFKPIAFTLLLSTLYVLISEFAEVDTFLTEAMNGIAAGLSDNNSEATLAVSLIQWLAKNHAATTLLLLPCMHLPLGWHLEVRAITILSIWY